MNTKLLEEFYKLIPEEKGQLFDTIAANRTNYLTVVLEEIFQEHNASAIIRTCDCFGIQELHVIEKENQYKVQRDIARGANKWVDMFNYNLGNDPIRDCFTALKKRGYRLAALTPDATETIETISLDQPIALVFGTEWEGISETVRNEVDTQIKIPMYGFTESFNVSVSVALTLQALRRRLETEQIDWRFSEEMQTLIKLRWCQKYMRNGDVVRKELEKRLSIL
jgi:tRNA (guanosine-2'-O-)-methyltransferase